MIDESEIRDAIRKEREAACEMEKREVELLGQSGWGEYEKISFDFAHASRGEHLYAAQVLKSLMGTK